LRAAFESALAREKNLASALAAAQQEVLDLDKRGIEYNVLLRELQSDRALYDSVLKRLKETDFSKHLDNSSISIVEPAQRPAAPVKLPVQLVGTVALVGTFFAALAFFYLLRVANKSIRTVDDAELSLGIPVWGAIPATRIPRKRLPHVVVEQPGSICSESFRTLRTCASLAARNGNKVHLFTSADPGEGKTFCSVNHAICQAQEGRHTLLIDLDLRKPSLGAGFSLPPDTPGVAEYLTGTRSLVELVQPVAQVNLFVLTAGSPLPNPAEALGKGELRQLLEEAARDYDRIVLDTAPILAVSDTLLILSLADTVCLVVRSGKTPRRAIARAMELMARANVSPSGIVLNFLPQYRGAGYYYHYGPEGRYGNKAVYGANLKALAFTKEI
jgi:capsular exopolysaccharide synthesis family protein